MTVTADEINILVRRHLQEMGYEHTAYVFTNEALVDHTKLNIQDLPPQALVSILKKGMLYMQMEKGINEKAKTESSPDNIIYSLMNAVRNSEAITPAPPIPLQPQNNYSNTRSQVNVTLKNPPPTPLLNVNLIRGQDHKHQVPPNTMEIPKSSVLILKEHTMDVYCGAWTKDGRYLATGSGDATAIIWEIKDHKSSSQHYCLDHATKQNRSLKDIATLAWNPTGTILATGCYDGTARLWTNHGELKHVLSSHDQPVFAVQFSPDGTMLLTGGADNKIVVWDVATGDVKQIFHYHKGRALEVDWLDNSTFASCSGDCTIGICVVGQSHPKFILDGHTKEVNKIEWDPSRTMLASCSDDRTVRIWRNFDKVPSYNPLYGHTESVYTIKWAPNDSKILASGAFDCTVRLWDAGNNSCIAVLTKHIQPIYTICFSPKGKYFVSGGIDNVMNMWETSTQSLIATYQADGGIFEAEWDESGQNIALCLSDATVALISTNDILRYQE